MKDPHSDCCVLMADLSYVMNARPTPGNHVRFCIKMGAGGGEMAQPFKAFAVLAEDSSF